MRIKLSIIIPYYNTMRQTEELLRVLAPQLTGETEVLLISDGGDVRGLEMNPVKIIRTANGGVSRARNIGLDNAGGEYIAFIDSDDLVSSDYVKTIISKTDEEWDYCFISWQAMAGRFRTKAYLSGDVETEVYHGWWSPSVWSCVYRKESLGDTRFNEKKVIAEDMEFSGMARQGRRALIKEIIYYYRTDRGDSLSDLRMMDKITEDYESLKELRNKAEK